MDKEAKIKQLRVTLAMLEEDITEARRESFSGPGISREYWRQVLADCLVLADVLGDKLVDLEASC